MKNKKLILFEQERENWSEKRLGIINKTLTDYTHLKNLSTSHMKEHCKRIATMEEQSFYYKEDLVVTVKEGFVFNGLSFEILYQVHEDLI